MNKSLINGIASEYLNVTDRAIHYGDGIFETILCQRRQLYYWQQHYQRLFTSANQLTLSCPEENVLLNDISLLLEDTNNENSKAHYSIKILITRGEGERGYLFPKNTINNRIVSISQLDANYSSILTGNLLSGALCYCKHQVSINRQLAGLKHLNRLDNVMARNEPQLVSKQNNIIDGLMLNENQFVVEGSMSNLFGVRNNELLTPKLNLSGVKGVMRQVIIDIVNELDIKLNITNLTKDDLASMDELFISNSLIGIKSVTELEASNYAQQKTTKRIFDQLLNTTKQHIKTV